MWLEKSLLTNLVSLIIYAFILALLVIKKNSFKKICYSTLLYIYIVMVFYVTILPLPLDEVGAESLRRLSVSNNYINIIPFIDMFNYGIYSFIKQVLGNIALFVPLGFLMPLVKEKYKELKPLIKFSFGFSLFIETMQLISCMFLIKGAFRIFDINDLLLNTLGSLIGYILYLNIVNILKKEEGTVDTRDDEIRA